MRAASGEQPAVAAAAAGSDVGGEAAGGGQPCERGAPPARRHVLPLRPPSPPAAASVPLPHPALARLLGEAEPFPPQRLAWLGEPPVTCPGLAGSPRQGCGDVPGEAGTPLPP